MAKKHLEIVLTLRLSGNGSSRLSTHSRPLKNLRASWLLGRHPRRRLLESMLGREHTPKSSILEDLVSRREHLPERPNLPVLAKPWLLSLHEFPDV